jgi:GntR family transcriptional regulator
MVQSYTHRWLPRVDTESPVPVYEQIVEQVALAVTAGELAPDDLLPSVRGLAAQLRINPNTAARAVRELEQAGLSRAVRGVGSVVDAQAKKVARQLAAGALRRELDGVIAVVRRLGMSLDDLERELRLRWREANDAS